MVYVMSQKDKDHPANKVLEGTPDFKASNSPFTRVEARPACVDSEDWWCTAAVFFFDIYPRLVHG